MTAQALRSSPGRRDEATARGAPVRVALADDHQLVREGLRSVLEAREDVDVIAEAGDRESLFAVLETTRPDVLLLDVTLADVDAIPLIPGIKSRAPSTRIVIVTMHRDPETVRQALFAGASGYVVKGARSSELVDAILAASRGERYLHTSVTAAVVDDSMRWLQHGDALSAREREVLSLFAGGASPADIGAGLGISVHTVRRHLANVSAKVGAAGRNELTRYAADHGIIRGRGLPGQRRR